MRNTSASSMQSPPASADATRVIILPPVFARPGARPRSRWLWTSPGRPRRRAMVAGRIRPALATRRWSSKTTRIRSGWFCGSIYWVILVLGSVFCSKTIIPGAQEHFLTPSARRDTHPFRWIGAKWPLWLSAPLATVAKILALFEAGVKTEGGSTATGTSLDAMVVASTGGGVFSQ